MDIERLITETLIAHEPVAPDSNAVFAAVRRRIDRRRVALSRPVAAAAGVAALMVATATVMALNPPGPTANDNVQAATSVTAATAPATPPIADLLMPYSLDWLPPGSVDYVARRTTAGATSNEPDATPLYGGEYMLNVTADGHVLKVGVQQMTATVDQAAFKTGPGNPVTINGQRGIESANSDTPGGYALYVAHPDGGSMFVHVTAEPAGTVPTRQLIDIGRRIAQNIRFPGTTTVTPTFGLRDLPNGMRVCTFSVALGRRGELTTHYSLGTCTTVLPRVSVSTGTTRDPSTGTPGRPVQGHATRNADDNGYRTLWVLDAVNGDVITLTGGVPLTELYEIANRLVLPH